MHKDHVHSKTPAEEVAGILEGIRKKTKNGSWINVDRDDIEFCIKTLKSGKLYKVSGKIMAS